MISDLIQGVARYRVHVGAFESETQAKRLLARMISNGYPGAQIVGD
jgi:SPOR domain